MNETILITVNFWGKYIKTIYRIDNDTKKQEYICPMNMNKKLMNKYTNIKLVVLK